MTVRRGCCRFSSQTSRVETVSRLSERRLAYPSRWNPPPIKIQAPTTMKPIPIKRARRGVIRYWSLSRPNPNRGITLGTCRHRIIDVIPTTPSTAPIITGASSMWRMGAVYGAQNRMPAWHGLSAPQVRLGPQMVEVGLVADDRAVVVLANCGLAGCHRWPPARKLRP